MSNNSTINVVTKKEIQLKKDKIAFNTLKVNITIYHTYPLLYSKGDIQMVSNNSTINVVTNKIYSKQNVAIYLDYFYILIMTTYSTSLYNIYIIDNIWHIFVSNISTEYKYKYNLKIYILFKYFIAFMYNVGMLILPFLHNLDLRQMFLSPYLH